MVVNESLSLREIGFEIEKTKDASPTLRLINGTERGGESMHHTGGAFSETCLIYGQAFKWGFEHSQNPVIVSLGLGLGYVEVLAAVYSLLHNSFSGFKVLSYETVPGLRQLFSDFYLKGKPHETYQWILEKMASHFGLEAQKIRDVVRTGLQEGRIQLKGDFVAEMSRVKGFDVFCYDAYSKKTSPELWDETLMTDVFSRGSSQACVSSYASNGVLKRALAAAGFRVEVLEGFQGKRNRTWACKGSS